MCSRSRSAGGNSGGWGFLAADRKSALVERLPVRRSDRGATLKLLLPLCCAGCWGVRGLWGVCSCTTLLLRLRRLLTLPTLSGRCIGRGSGVWYAPAGGGWLLGRPGDFTSSSPWYSTSFVPSSVVFRTGVSGRGCRTCSGFISSRGVPCLEPMVRASSAPCSGV